jgi:acetoacetyl-CoA reductase
MPQKTLHQQQIVVTIPVRCLGRPDEIGSIVAWLASKESGFSTGADSR